MARLSDARPPAEPSSQGQRDRYSRMLRAAVKLGSEQDFERVQMQDVAAESEVAIATLYRYFPSKVHLFVGVMRAELEKVDPRSFVAQEGQDLDAVVTDLLMLFTKEMYANRRLSMSMIQSIILSEGLDSPDSSAIEEAFLALLLRVAGWHRSPTADQRRRCWLVIQCWFGVLVTTLSGSRPLDSAEEDVRRACELLLSHGRA